MQAAPDIICRAAYERVGMRLLEQLTERRFHKRRGSSDERYHPHPEHGTRTAHGNSCGYACQIAGAYACGHGNGKGLKAGDMFMLALPGHAAVGKQTHHLAQHAKLHKTSAPREPYSAAQEHTYQHISP